MGSRAVPASAGALASSGLAIQSGCRPGRHVCAPRASHGIMETLRDRLGLARWAPVPLRLIVGYGFMAHGFAKLSRGVGAFALILQTLGVPAPGFMAWSTILVELLGGLAVLLGAFVPLVSIPMAAVLLVAVLTVHLPFGFNSIKL